MRFALFILVCLALVTATSAAEPPLETVLVDFENAQAVKLAPNQSKANLVPVDGGTALEMVNDAAADYPNVRIEPTAGKWDLTGCEWVMADVRNPQDVPLRVLISVNNPGADGQNKCSVAATTIGPGETGVATVPLGIWHGSPRPFDVSHVASLDLLLDKPGREHRFTIDNLRAVRREKFDFAKAEADPFFQALKPPFGRGINLGNALEAPNEGEWGVKLEESYFAAIKEAGFDSIRLPVRWSNHAQYVPPYALEEKFLARVDWAVEQALSRGLQVVLNVHHYSEMDEKPDEHRARLVGLWTNIAEHYRDRPATLAFELLNEPHDNLSAGKWNAILKETLAVVRKSNPTRTVVIGGVAWNSIGQLKTLELPEDDRNLVATVHYYDPFTFTHQGAHWLGHSAPPKGTKWTGTEAEREAVTRAFDMAILWGLKHKRPVYLGEFGALNTADMESRARWTKFVADEAARRKMGSAYWEFCSGFGAYDPEKHAWIEPLKNALIPAK